MPLIQQDIKKEEELEKKLRDIHHQELNKQYETLAKKQGLPFSTFQGIPVDSDALIILDEKASRNAGAGVVYKSNSKITIAVTDPDSPAVQEIVNNFKNQGLTVNMIVTTPDSLELIFRNYKIIKTKTFKIGAIEIDEEELAKLQEQIADIRDIQTKLSSISTTELLEIIIAGALKVKASDIHFEPEAKNTRIRYRIDGILKDVTDLSRDYYAKILNRVKILSKMKLNIQASPQDGRLTISQRGADIEVRVSVITSEFGETIAMRLLDPRTIKSSLEELGLRKDLLETVYRQLQRRAGAILVSGPTGSGKTTTLYAFTDYLNKPGVKIITIEDPIEYHIKDISQTQVDPKKGYTFANGLRSIVRQDPDIILIGEIRDNETAEIALHAALTGHLMLSTIHTNDAAGIIPRLIDLGIKPQIIAPAINITIAQRLIRKLCQKCKKQIEADEMTIKKIKQVLDPIKSRIQLPEINSKLKLYESSADGCSGCHFSGYLDRIGVFELFLVSEKIEELILSSPSVSAIRGIAVKDGMITMLQDAYIKFLNGIVSIEEIERIIS